MMPVLVQERPVSELGWMRKLLDIAQTYVGLKRLESKNGVKIHLMFVLTPKMFFISYIISILYFTKVLMIFLCTTLGKPSRECILVLVDLKILVSVL